MAKFGRLEVLNKRQILPLIFFSLNLAISVTPATAQTATAHPGDEFRKRLGIEFPHTDRIIIVHCQSAHHLTDEYLFVAHPQGDTWKIEGINEERSGLLKIEPKVTTDSVELPPDQARRLDEMLASHKLYSDPVDSSPANVVGTPFCEMELVTPQQRRFVAWQTKMNGRLGDVLNLILNSLDQKNPNR